MLPELDPQANKYSRGSLLLIAGSARFTGAPVLAATAALAAARTGAGYTTLMVPASILQVVQAQVAPSIPVLSGEEDEGSFAGAAADQVLSQKHLDALVLGPGMTVTPGTIALTTVLLQDLDAPVVLDADGLNVLAQSSSARQALVHRGEGGRGTLLTPHAGELQRLLEAFQADSPSALSQSTGALVIAKGPTTCICTPEGGESSSTYGGPELAKAGTGDVLSGILGSLLAQGMEDRQAAEMGVRIHGLAGKDAASRLGARSVMAEDLVESVPGVIRELDGFDIGHGAAESV